MTRRYDNLIATSVVNRSTKLVGIVALMGMLLSSLHLGHRHGTMPHRHDTPGHVGNASRSSSCVGHVHGSHDAHRSQTTTPAAPNSPKTPNTPPPHDDDNPSCPACVASGLAPMALPVFEIVALDDDDLRHDVVPHDAVVVATFLTASRPARAPPVLG